MPVIAVLNRKGGSGKSTLATNLASLLAREGESVMLGDLDRQQSARMWLDERPEHLPRIMTWSRNNDRVFRAPPGTTHVVLDTPGALYDYELSKILVWVDCVIVPVGPSHFDQEVSARLIDDLKRIPRVSSQRCSVITVGMRWGRTATDRWKHEYCERATQLVTVLEHHEAYQEWCSHGLGIFDLPAGTIPTSCIKQWDPILQWIRLHSKKQRPMKVSNIITDHGGCVTNIWSSLDAHPV